MLDCAAERGARRALGDIGLRLCRLIIKNILTNVDFQDKYCPKYCQTGA